MVKGFLPDKLDIWRISPVGPNLERITSDSGRVSHPVLLDRRTLLYLVSNSDSSGPWLHSMNLERRIPHRPGPVLACRGAAGRSNLADDKRWVSPRLGPNYLLYVSATGTSQSIWKLANVTSTELWRGQGARILGVPAISPMCALSHSRVGNTGRRSYT